MGIFSHKWNTITSKVYFLKLVRIYTVTISYNIYSNIPFKASASTIPTEQVISHGAAALSIDGREQMSSLGFLLVLYNRDQVLEKTETCKHQQKPLSSQRIRKRPAQENRLFSHSNNLSPTKYHKINCGPFSKCYRNLRLLPLQGYTEATKGPTSKWYHIKLRTLPEH